jgi:hypothetical protein
MTLTTERQQFAEQNEMSMDFVNWFFDEKKESFSNMWFLMAAALWEGWKGRANREAQPVAFPEAKDKSQGWKIDPEYLQAIADTVGCSDDEGAPSMELVEAVLLAAAPPAPAVPEEAKVGEMPFLGNGEPGCVRGWNDFRAAMLAQPVSQRYTFPPHVYRELVNSLRDTAVKYQGTQQLREQLSRTLTDKGLSAAAPEGGN